MVALCPRSTNRVAANGSGIAEVVEFEKQKLINR